MSEHGSYSTTSRLHSHSHHHQLAYPRDIPYRQQDDLESESSRFRQSREKLSKYQQSSPKWADVPAPLPVCSPPARHAHSLSNRRPKQPSPPTSILPYHPSHAHSSSLSRGPARVSQPTTPSTPPNRVPLTHRVPTSQYSSRLEYTPASPTQGSYLSRSPPRPSSSGRDSRKIHSRRGSRSSPKQKIIPRNQWPPIGKGPRDILNDEEALQKVGTGALEMKGETYQLPHTSEDICRFYATVYVDDKPAKDTVSNPDETLKDISLSFMGAREGLEPSGTLEYPNMLYAFGKSPGTTTLTWFIGMQGQLRSPLDYSDSGVKKRKMKLISILERLKELEEGLDQRDDDQYNYLYSNLIEDPERYTNPHRDRAYQIKDLVLVLMNKEWTDLSIPKNQVVAKFWDSPDEKVKTRFFHQLLLAVELHLRIQHKEHHDGSKRQLLQGLPPKVLWDLALAQRWLENVGIEQETISSEDSEFHFKLRSKKKQKNALKHFARLLKWPNMEDLEYALDERDRNSTPVEERSADTMCWFTGVVLPGPTLPFVLMNSLIDCDEETGSELGYLTHVKPSCGFQYRANTYWSYKCILGKVLGASRGVKQVSGWIGPCQFSPDLGRSQCLLIETTPLPESTKKLTAHDIEHMGIFSDVLGPDDIQDDYRVRDFDIPNLPEAEGEEIIRIQKLAFVEIRDPAVKQKRGAKPHQAAVVFAVQGFNLPIHLRHDVDFICAAPCESGPHPLFRGYRTRIVRVEDGLREMAGWNGSFESRGSSMGSRSMALALRENRPFGLDQGDKASEYYQGDWFDEQPDLQDKTHHRRLVHQCEEEDEDDEMTTLVVDASGVSDNEVFARAWCAHWGEHAVVANLKGCCVACAVRVARAAKVRVVIVTEGGREEEKDRGVWDLLSTVG